MTQRLVLAVVLAFTVLLAFLTVFALAVHGPGVLTLLSLLVVALLVVGVFGAFSAPPDRRR